MKIALVSPGYPPDVGGVESVVGKLARHLVAAGDEVTVFTHVSAVAADSSEDNGVAVQRYPRVPRSPISASLVRAVGRSSADIWHAHNAHSYLPAAVWLARARPYVITAYYHGGGHTPGARALHVPYTPVLRRTLKQAAAVTAVSRYEAALLQDRFDIGAHVIPDGIDPAPIRTVARHSDESGVVRVLAVGRLSAYKRTDLVVRAIALLPRHYSATIVGGGQEVRALRALAAELGVTNRVLFETEPLTDEALQQRFRDADVYINLSEAESFGVTVLEALAAGTPVVVSGLAALAEWPHVFPKAVFSVDRQSPEAAATAIDLAGRTGRVDVDLSSFSWDTVITSVRQVYEGAAR